MYVFLRGLVLLVRCGNLPRGPAWRRRLLAPTRATHGDVALMCLAVTQLGYSWMVTPKVGAGRGGSLTRVPAPWSDLSGVGTGMPGTSHVCTGSPAGRAPVPVARVAMANGRAFCMAIEDTLLLL